MVTLFIIIPFRFGKSITTVHYIGKIEFNHKIFYSYKNKDLCHVQI